MATEKQIAKQKLKDGLATIRETVEELVADKRIPTLALFEGLEEARVGIEAQVALLRDDIKAGRA